MNNNVEPFPFYSVGGTPSERGRQYGRQARERIAVSLAIYERAFDRSGLTWKDVRPLAHAFMPSIEAYEPSFLEEMRGIAAGADVEVERIVALNARTELLYGRAEQPPGPVEQGEGCTAAVALPEATLSGELIHGQNWDWLVDCVRSAVVLRLDTGEGNPFLGFMEAGMLARAGFNASGIALTGNFLASARDRGRAGVPIPFLRRRILESRDLGTALGAVYSAPRAFSNNMMISHAGGMAVNLEASPDEVFWLKPEHGLMVHANHFKAPGALAKIRDVGILTSPDTLYRDDRVLDHLRAKHGRLEVADFCAAFRDSFGSPKAVCRAPTSGPGGSGVATVATLVMQPAAGHMWIAPAPYLGSEFTRYSLA
jgi:isopenicillin-N N-acyltransferase-like protein